MKKYDVKVRTVKENIISVQASSEKEAISKVEELAFCSSLLDIDIRGITKHYFIIDVVKKSLFKRRKK